MRVKRALFVYFQAWTQDMSTFDPDICFYARICLGPQIMSSIGLCPGQMIKKVMLEHMCFFNALMGSGSFTGLCGYIGPPTFPMML